MAKLNRMLVGWANYFCLGPVSKAYRAVDPHVTKRLRRWLCRKHKVPGRGNEVFPDKYLYDALGLVRLPTSDTQPPVGESMSLVREPDAGNPPVRFDEREVETELGQTGLRRQSESRVN